MHVTTWVASQPALDRGVFVCGIVVGDQMQGLALWGLAVNQEQERQSFLMPMAREAHGDDRALRDMQGDKKGVVVPCRL
jgi:hypothetical protein